MSGLDLSDDELDALVPQVQRAAEGLAGLDALDLDDVEPAIVFDPGKD